MLSPLVRDALARLRAGVEARLGSGEIAALAVFGSYARGEADEDSDVDVLVVLEHDAPHANATVAEVAAALYPALGLLVNPVTFARAEYERRLAGGHPLLRTIAREGIAA